MLLGVQVFRETTILSDLVKGNTMDLQGELKSWFGYETFRPYEPAQSTLSMARHRPVALSLLRTNVGSILSQ